MEGVRGSRQALTLHSCLSSKPSTRHRHHHYHCHSVCTTPQSVTQCCMQKGKTHTHRAHTHTHTLLSNLILLPFRFHKPILYLLLLNLNDVFYSHLASFSFCHSSWCYVLEENLGSCFKVVSIRSSNFGGYLKESPFILSIPVKCCGN